VLPTTSSPHVYFKATEAVRSSGRPSPEFLTSAVLRTPRSGHSAQVLLCAIVTHSRCPLLLLCPALATTPQPNLAVADGDVVGLIALFKDAVSAGIVLYVVEFVLRVLPLSHCMSAQFPPSQQKNDDGWQDHWNCVVLAN